MKQHAASLVYVGFGSWFIGITSLVPASVIGGLLSLVGIGLYLLLCTTVAHNVRLLEEQDEALEELQEIHKKVLHAAHTMRFATEVIRGYQQRDAIPAQDRILN